jgi:hypothetical protein
MCRKGSGTPVVGQSSISPQSRHVSMASGSVGPKPGPDIREAKAMASIEKRPDGRYRARWREYPGGPLAGKHFDRKADAERFLDRVRGDLARGDYTEGCRGRDQNTCEGATAAKARRHRLRAHGVQSWIPRVSSCAYRIARCCHAVGASQRLTRTTS